MKFKNIFVFNIGLSCVCIILYIINKFIICKQESIYCYLFFKNHFNDLLAIVIAISLLNIYCVIEDLKLIDNLFVIILICIFFSVIWEGVVPKLKVDSVADFKDVLCYFTGGIIYWLLIKIFIKLRRSQSEQKF